MLETIVEVLGNMFRIATKSGNSAKIKEFYFQSGKIKETRKTFQKIKDYQGF